MDSRTLLPATAFRARALLLGARLDLRNWPEGETLARLPLAVRLPEGGVAVLFRYGVAVLFGVTAEDEHALREKLAPLIEHQYRIAEVEELGVRVDEGRAEGLLEGALVVQSASLERLQLIADALSKSLLLGHYETRIAGEFDRIEPLALELERLYALLETEFEIRERLAALGRKLDLVARTVRTLVELIDTRHSLRVEWYIVILIVVEILLTLYDMWLR